MFQHERPIILPRKATTSGGGEGGALDQISDKGVLPASSKFYRWLGQFWKIGRNLA